MNIQQLRHQLAAGLVIPACPLALDQDRNWSPRHQRALTRYYFAAGAGGLAVGVHSTQFAIREPEHDLYGRVLESVAIELDRLTAAAANEPRPLVRVAGVCGRTSQALAESEIALSLGYDAALLSMTAFRNSSDRDLLDHCSRVGDAIPLIGFYLQPAVGGKVYGYEFWRKFLEIPNLVAIKVAPFNRYQTLDVARALIESNRNDVSLYTGNDDNIILDLLTPFSGVVDGQRRTRYFDGGLLGQWGVWTRRAVELLERIKRARHDPSLLAELLSENSDLTDANAAIFDAAHGFAGCIPGIMEVLTRAGLAPSNCCLNPEEVLSPGQSAELDRVISRYPQLLDDEFVQQNLSRWLED